MEVIMGSFNVACSVSSLSIHPRDKIIFIPLQVSQYPYKIGDGSHHLIYPWCFYSPVTLPIFGWYGDYGRINDIMMDENVRRVEAFFGKDINDICDPMSHTVEPITSGMFVLADIYWTLVKKCIGDCGEIAMKRKDIGNRYVALQAALNPKPRYPGHQDLEDAMYRLTLMDVKAGNILGFREYDILPKIYHPAIKEGKMKKQLIDYARFEMSLFMCNKIFFPAQNGCQFGNAWMERVLASKTLELARKRRRYW